MDLPVVCDHVACVLGRADVPGFARVIQQRRVAPPAMRVAVRGRFFFEEQSAGFQIRHDGRVGGLEELAGVWSGRIQELAPRIERLDHGKVMLLGCLVVVFTVSRRHVYDAGAVGHRDKVAADHTRVRTLCR